ncbi:MAG: hypothetical protein HWE26_01105 [Alteromonadaceae bacterium]|nr:hypothetical protein [Alteromonadaceae bacterium]
MTTKLALLTSLTIASAVVSASADAAPAQVNGLIEFGVVQSHYDSGWLNSWLDEGVGVLRFSQNGRFILSQAGLELSQDVTTTLSAHLVANGYTDGRQKLGFSEAYLRYKPITAGLRHELKLGMFYPKMSLENVDTAWNSPYTYSYSAINSWLAEELRTIGAEYTITRSGRMHRSPFSYSATVAAFKANDVLGAILTWRGWALHNRQSRYNESLPFADYFQFNQFELTLPNTEMVTEETDGRWGVYAGLNWRYLNKTDVRVYYYDNMANRLAIEANNQYAWDTHFSSVALQHKFTSQFRVLAQWLSGSTYMGRVRAGVFADFSAWYVMASYKVDQHRLSVRFDQFKVNEKDLLPEDPNDSHGYSVTFAWRYQLNHNWNIGVEWLGTASTNKSRTLWQGWQARQSQQQALALVQFRF